jgi:hypothetical protein
MSHSYSCKVHECGEAFTSRSEAIKHAKKHAGIYTQEISFCILNLL